MRKNSLQIRSSAALMIMGLAAFAALPKPIAAAKASDMVQKVERFLGIEKWNLKTVQKDPRSGKPTFERGDYRGQHVERKTAYHENGRKATQELAAVSKQTGKLLYAEKVAFARNGEMERKYVESSVYNGEGQQIKGEGWEKHYAAGRLTKEAKKEWSTERNDWIDTYVRVQTYYPDGDLKERIVENFADNKKTKETWDLDPNGKRKKVSLKWNADTRSWE